MTAARSLDSPFVTTLKLSAVELRILARSDEDGRALFAELRGDKTKLLPQLDLLDAIAGTEAQALRDRADAIRTELRQHLWDWS